MRYLETMKHSIAWGVATLLTSATMAQSTVTFHADIAPIVYAHAPNATEQGNWPHAVHHVRRGCGIRGIH